MPSHSQEIFTFKEQEIIKMRIDYCSKREVGNDKRYSTDLLFKIEEMSEITVDEFVDSFVTFFIKEGLARLQSTNTRWEKIRIYNYQYSRDVGFADSQKVYMRSLKGVYGLLERAPVLEAGLKFELWTTQGGLQRRFYLRSCPAQVAFFDAPGNERLFAAVTYVESLFVNPLSQPGNNNNLSYKLQFMVRQKH